MTKLYVTEEITRFGGSLACKKLVHYNQSLIHSLMQRLAEMNYLQCIEQQESICQENDQRMMASLALHKPLFKY